MDFLTQAVQSIQSNIIPLSVMLGILLLIMAVSSFRKQARGRDEFNEAAAQKLPEGTIEVCLDGSQHASGSNTEVIDGRVMLVLAGTFGAHLGEQILGLLDVAGLSNAVGSILLIEFDASRRAAFIKGLPNIYADKAVYVESETLSGGLINRDEAYAEKMRPHWEPEVRNKARAATDLHERLYLRRYAEARGATGNTHPSLVLVCASLGSTGSFIGPTAVSVILDEFEGAQCIGFSAYPKHDKLRASTKFALEAYKKAGCGGFIVADNLPDDGSPERDLNVNDLGMASIPAGLIGATLQKDAPTEPNNAYSLLLPDGGLASYRVYSDTVVAELFQPHPRLPPRYYVARESMKTMVLKILDELERPENAAVGADLGRVGTSTFDIILTALVPESLTELSDAIQAAKHVKSGRSVQIANYDLLFSGMQTLIDPRAPVCPVVGVKLSALSDTMGHLDEIVSRATNPT
jgi:hypothetical protein